MYAGSVSAVMALLPTLSSQDPEVGTDTDQVRKVDEYSVCVVSQTLTHYNSRHRVEQLPTRPITILALHRDILLKWKLMVLPQLHRLP